ncbi:MAG: hypothetical protein QXD51_01375 [Candidatus Anstonellales archaeon]
MNVKCSEIRLFVINRKAWFLSLLGMSKKYLPMGRAKHEAIFSDTAEDNHKVVFDTKDRFEVEMVKKLIFSFGKPKQAEKKINPVYKLIGKADGFINGLPFEVKFCEKENQGDFLQAASYALLYSTSKSYLFYPSRYFVVDPNEYVDRIADVVDKILAVKEALFYDTYMR